MTKKLFGTDGIRGEANKQLTPELALKVGMASGIHFFRRDIPGHRHRVVVGKDTRLSCYMLEQAIIAGLLSAGMDVLQTGPIPTPGVAQLIRSMRADFGIMISASHNGYMDNGIKLFGPDGYKLSDQDEAAIEQLIGSDMSTQLATGAQIGRAKRIDDGQGRYMELVKNVVPNLVLDGLRIVVDCAHGAGYRVAPEVLKELGAHVFAIGVEPNGTNINDKCGSTAPKALIEAVYRHGAHVGVALDGDADRVLLVDEKGNEVGGDQILAIIAGKSPELFKNGVVGTVMTNTGLERYLRQNDIPLHRAKVGDRYVLEMMREKECLLGGESSGHIILSPGTTGDGLVAALQVLSVLKEAGCKMSELADCFERIPQELRNIRAPKEVLDLPAVQEAVRAAEAKVSAEGRLNVRASGTEPLIRVMVEHPDRKIMEEVFHDLTSVIKTA
ncbi:phosphoglucosamine mutase [Patescibacteria group bacterium]|nr:phosphoglucosamine mutase [Patescibacteria group bacterium]